MRPDDFKEPIEIRNATSKTKNIVPNYIIGGAIVGIAVPGIALATYYELGFYPDIVSYLGGTLPTLGASAGFTAISTLIGGILGKSEQRKLMREIEDAKQGERFSKSRSEQELTQIKSLELDIEQDFNSQNHDSPKSQSTNPLHSNTPEAKQFENNNDLSKDKNSPGNSPTEVRMHQTRSLNETKSQNKTPG